MPRVPPRILVPVVAAVCCVAGLLVFLWWQLADTHQQLSQQLRQMLSPIGSPTQTGTTIVSIAVDAGDEALLHMHRGDLLALQGEWTEAAAEYGKAVDAKGGLTALRKLEQAQLQIRDIPAARSTLEKLRRAGARSEDLLLVETIILLRTGELVKAGQLLQSSPASPQQHYGLALLALVQGNHEETRKQLQDVMNGWEPVLRTYARTLLAAYDEYALFPNSPGVHLDTLLARALAQVQECELALPLLSRVTQAQADYRDAWIVQGYCELTTARSREALASFEQAYNLDPEKPEIQYFLGRSYAAMEDSANAITFLRYALQNGFQPEADVRRLLAKQAARAGQMDLALEQEDALTRLPDATLDAFRSYADAALRFGKKEEAVLKAIDATAKWPEDARAWEFMGDIAVAAEKKDEAKRAYETALKKNPNLNAVREKMGRL